MTVTRAGTDWLTTADPSWYPRVLTILQRDFPDAADMAWSTAISENAADQIARYGSTGRTTGEAVTAPAIGNTLCSCGTAGFHWCSPAERAPVIGAIRPCPDCGRPQHYTGVELGWCHDATFATLVCGASPALLAELEK